MCLDMVVWNVKFCFIFIESADEYPNVVKQNEEIC